MFFGNCSGFSLLLQIVEPQQQNSSGLATEPGVKLGLKQEFNQEFTQELVPTQHHLQTLGVNCTKQRFLRPKRPPRSSLLEHSHENEIMHRRGTEHAAQVGIQRVRVRLSLVLSTAGAAGASLHPWLIGFLLLINCFPALSVVCIQMIGR